jgi:hypothetical protein
MSTVVFKNNFHLSIRGHHRRLIPYLCQGRYDMDCFSSSITMHFQLQIWYSLRSRKPRLTTVGIRCADHATPSIRKKKLALTSSSGGSSVGIARAGTKATGFSLVLVLRLNSHIIGRLEDGPDILMTYFKAERALPAFTSRDSGTFQL